MDESGLKCLSCGTEGMERGFNELDVPHFGKVIHYYMRCPHCGFRVNDFAYQGDFPPEAKLEVIGKQNLNSKIVRGGNATVIIPELGLELYPGPLSESFITNVEGLLNRFKNLLPLFDDKEQIKKVEEKLEEAISGKLDFSIIIRDPARVSHFMEVE